MADDEMMTDALPTGGGGFDWADDVAAEHAASGHDAAVLEAEKEKARKRAERFGQEYKEPKANAIARGLMSRKEVLAMRKEAALKKMNRRGEFVAGIDVFDPAEQAKRAARAAKFGTAAPSALTPEQQAIKDKRDAQDAQRLAANAAALQEAYADAMDDGTTRGAADGAVGSNASAEVVQDFFERRVDPELDASWRADAVHLYGVDHMTTAECVGYFSEYGPVFCEWINDSSCNVVFNDETTARRAIRMKGVAMGAEANPDGGLALPAGTCAEMLWHAGPEFHKDNRAIQLSFRLATEEDIKPDGKIKSRYLWLAGKGGGRGKRRRGGGAAAAIGTILTTPAVRGEDAAGGDGTAAACVATTTTTTGVSPTFANASGGKRRRRRMPRWAVTTSTSRVRPRRRTRQLRGKAARAGGDAERGRPPSRRGWHDEGSADGRRGGSRRGAASAGDCLLGGRRSGGGG